MRLITENQTDMLNSIVLEEIDKMLPTEFKQFYQSQNNRKIILQKYGEQSFLLPKALKFPIVDPNTGKPDCRLIYAAYIRAKQWVGKNPEYKEVIEKAKSLYDNFECKNTIKVAINESDIVMDLDVAVSIFQSE